MLRLGSKGLCHPFSRVHGINSLPLSFAREKGLAVPRVHIYHGLLNGGFLPLDGRLLAGPHRLEPSFGHRRQRLDRRPLDVQS